MERLIGSIRRECLDHIIVLNQAHLHRLLKSYFAYYHRSWTQLALHKDAPEARSVQGPEDGKIVVRLRRWADFIIATNDSRPERKPLLSGRLRGTVQ